MPRRAAAGAGRADRGTPFRGGGCGVECREAVTGQASRVIEGDL